MSSELIHLNRRLDLLERQNRRYRWTSLGLIVAGILTLPILANAGDDDNQTIRAESVVTERLAIVDSEDKVRILASTVGTSTPAVSLMDAAGQTRVTIAITKKDSPIIALMSPKGKTMGTLMARTEGGGHLVLFDGEGKRAAAIP